MSRKAQWIVVLGLITGLAGCADDASKKIVRTLPPPITPAPPRIQEAAPDPSLMAVRPPVSGLRSLRGKKIVIDAGHGGKDPGTRGVSRLAEKTIVLSIANEVARLDQDRGATVICTRTTDRFLELDERAAIAQRNRADLFVAIHADSAQRSSASGATVYINKTATGASLTAARSVVRALTSSGIECRGIRRANYRVLVAHTRPAILVECGYLTNPGDASHLNTQQYRSKVAAAVARGVADYLCPG